MAMAKQRMVSFGEAFAKFWTRWTLEGRSSRSEYWWAVLFRGLLIIGIKFIAEASAASGAILPQAAKVIYLIAWFTFFGPFVCLTVRRLHDIGKAGAWMWLWLGPDAINQIFEFQGNSWLLNLQAGCFTDDVIFAIAIGIVGLIGAIVMLIFTTRPSQRAVNTYGLIPNMPEGFGNICPNCENAIPVIAFFCPHCGTRIKAEVPKEEPSASHRAETPERESPETIGEVKTNAPSGVRQRQAGEQQPNVEQKKSDGAEDEDTVGNFLKILIAIVALVAVCVIGNYFTKDSSSESTKSTTSGESSAKTAYMSEECRQLLEAARSGDVEAQNNLGANYYNGDGVEKDFSVAAYWIRKAADQGDVTAQRNMGILYLNGEGVLKNAVLAVEWLTKAADQGSPEAMEVLAECYEKGIGVEADFMKGIRLRADAATERARKNNH